MSGILENALADAIQTMRDVERRMEISSLGECKWRLIRAADLAQTALHSEAKLHVKTSLKYDKQALSIKSPKRHENVA